MWPRVSRLRSHRQETSLDEKNFLRLPLSLFPVVKRSGRMVWLGIMYSVANQWVQIINYQLNILHWKRNVLEGSWTFRHIMTSIRYSNISFGSWWANCQHSAVDAIKKSSYNLDPGRPPEFEARHTGMERNLPQSHSLNLACRLDSFMSVVSPMEVSE